MTQSYLYVHRADEAHPCMLCVELEIAERADNARRWWEGVDNPIDKHRADAIAEIVATGNAYLCLDHEVPFARRLARDIEGMLARKAEQAPLL